MERKEYFKILKEKGPRLMVLFLYVIICLVCLLSENGYAQEPENMENEKPRLYSRSALLMDASNNRVLYEENGYSVMPMASTTKILTCILAIEYMESSEYDKEKPVVASAYACSMPKVHLGMRKGDEYRLEDLLYSLMLESHNDTAVAIAEYIDGSVEGFAKRMNQKAFELGCENSCFITPNGLDQEEDGKVHSTTAYDLALIASYAIKNETFCEIIGTQQYHFDELTTNKTYCVNNHNQFLHQMDGAFGIKTGFTGNAGYCFVGALKRDERVFVGVLLGCGWPPNKNWKWTDIKKIMTYGIDHYSIRSIKKDMPLMPIKVENGIENEVPIYLENESDEELKLMLSKQDQVQVKINVSSIIDAPVDKDIVVGHKEYYLNNILYRSYEIRTKKTIKLRTYYYCVRQIFMLYF